jgi:hypothetical protein
LPGNYVLHFPDFSSPLHSFSSWMAFLLEHMLKHSLPSLLRRCVSWKSF